MSRGSGELAARMPGFSERMNEIETDPLNQYVPAQLGKKEDSGFYRPPRMGVPTCSFVQNLPGYRARVRTKYLASLGVLIR
mgnify:CR=1 FL=1